MTFRPISILFSMIAILMAVTLNAHSSQQWGLLKTFRGEFIGAPNTDGELYDKLEAQAHRSVSFAIPADIRLLIRYSADKSIPKNWPNDVPFTPGINLTALVTTPDGDLHRYIIARQDELKISGGSILKLLIDEETFSSGFKTFYPAKWRVDVLTQANVAQSVTLPAVTAQAGGAIQVVDPVAPVAVQPNIPDIPDINDPQHPECGDQAECVVTQVPEKIEEDKPPVDTDKTSPKPDKPVSSTKNPGDAFDLAFWTSIKDSTNAALFKAYLDKFPDGVFAIIAREKLKLLTKPNAVQSGVPLPAAGNNNVPKDYVIGLQRELARVGCNPGTADGKWGAKSAAALENFNKYAGTRLAGNPPGQAAFEAVRKMRQPVCPKTSALTITRQGIGGFTAKTAMKLSAVKKSLPDYNINLKLENEGEGIIDHIFTVKDGTKVMLIIEAVDQGNGKPELVAVRVVSPRIASEDGLRIGMRFSQAAAKLRRWRCSVDGDDDQKFMSCWNDNSRFSYTFEHAGFAAMELGDDIGADNIPPQAKLSEIRWTVPG